MIGGGIRGQIQEIEDYENVPKEVEEKEPTVLESLPFAQGKGISLFSVFTLTVNIMIGTGVFGMPLAYYKAGLLLSIGLLLLFNFLTSINAVYLLEAIARVGTYLKRTDLLNGYKHSKVEIYESYGYTSIASYTLGKVFKIVINVMMVVNCYGVLWSFVGTAVNSFSSIFWSFFGDSEACPVIGHFSLGWECQLTYYASVVVFGCIVIPLSFMKLSSQTFIQMAMMGYCVVTFTLMIATCLINIIFGEEIEEVSWFSFSGFGSVFSHTAFALVCHINVPDIISSAEKKNKTHIPIISALLTVSGFYGLVGCVCAICFGSQTKTPVTLNWGNYTGRGAGWGEGSVEWYGYIVKYVIMIFPIVNLVSSFPIMSQTVSGNIASMFPREMLENEGSKTGKLIKYGCLIVSIAGPFALGCISSSLELIFDLAGLVSFLLVFVCPAVFHILSIRMFRRLSLLTYSPKTPFSFFMSAPIIVSIIFTLCMSLFFVSVVVMVYDLFFASDIIASSSSL